jgi:energy-converting hydrogenase Eha subunit C
MLAIAIHFAASRRLAEVGCLLGALGGIAVLLSAAPLMRRVMVIAGGLLLAGGFVLLLVSIHYGASPFRPGR